MLTAEDISLGWDRLTTWFFSQKTETILLVALLVFMGYMYKRSLDENTALRRELIELAKEKAK